MAKPKRREQEVGQHALDFETGAAPLAPSASGALAAAGAPAGDDPFDDEDAPPSPEVAPAPPTAPAPAPPTPTANGGRRRTVFRDSAFIDGETIRRSFGADLRELLDPRRWDRDPDPAETIRTISERARRVVDRTRAQREPVRALVQQFIEAEPDRYQLAGFHSVTEPELLEVARTVLYNGATEAVCGDYVVHDTIPLAIAQAGVCVVGYSGRQRQWHQRILREEWEIELDEPLAEVEALFEYRDRIGRPGQPSRMQMLNQLARRGFVSYMERQVMLSECPGKWRMGEGVPVPLDLLSAAPNLELLEMSLELLRNLLLGDTRWLFVSPTFRDGGLQMIGDALQPLEFVVLHRLRMRLDEQLDHSHYPQHYLALAREFVREVGPRIVVGAFRAGVFSPPWIFFAHEESVYEAALIAMADSLALQPDGFPPLLRLARVNCHTALGGEAFEQLVRQAYREAGAPEWFLRGPIR